MNEDIKKEPSIREPAAAAEDANLAAAAGLPDALQAAADDELSSEMAGGEEAAETPEKAYMNTADDSYESASGVTASTESGQKRDEEGDREPDREAEEQRSRNPRKDYRKIKVNTGLIAAAFILFAAVMAATILILPKYGAAYKEYRGAHSAYKAAEADLAKAQKKNDELTASLDELKALTKESGELSAEVFSLASQLEQDIIAGKSNKKICYITLDDGPYSRGKKWLDLFNQYDIKATFFLTTANGDKLPDQGDESASSMYPEYLKYGHTIGNHTYSHNYSSGGIYSSADKFMESVEKQEEFTAQATGGYRPAIVRFPGGTSTAGSELGAIEEALRSKGYTWADWTVDSGDSWGNGVTSKTIKKNIKDAAKKQKIMVILCHEWSQSSLDAMPEVIDYLEEKGYTFLPLFPESVVVEK